MKVLTDYLTVFLNNPIAEPEAVIKVEVMAKKLTSAKDVLEAMRSAEEPDAAQIASLNSHMGEVRKQLDEGYTASTAFHMFLERLFQDKGSLYIPNDEIKMAIDAVNDASFSYRTFLRFLMIESDLSLLSLNSCFSCFSQILELKLILISYASSTYALLSVAQ